MRVIAVHPYAVRFEPRFSSLRRRPARPWDGLAYGRAETPVEVPELAPGTFGDERVLALHSHAPFSYVVHAGRCWNRLVVYKDGKPAWATPEDLVAYLSDPNEIRIASSLVRTPLAGGFLYGSPPRGGEVAKPLREHAEAARIAVRSYVAENLATDGTGVFAVRSMPVVTPYGEGRNSATDKLMPYELSATRVYGSARNGPCFEPDRFDDMNRFLQEVGYVGSENLSVVENAVCSVTLGVPYRGDDIAAYAQSAPTAVLEHLSSLRAKVPAGDLAGIESIAARLQVLGDIGSLGGIPAGAHADTLRLVDALATDMIPLHPKGTRTRDLRVMSAYVRLVALPALSRDTVPDEDLAAISALGPA